MGLQSNRILPKFQNIYIGICQTLIAGKDTNNMRKAIKRILLIIGIVIVAIIIALNYHSHFSKAAIKGKENITFSKSIRIGMTKDEVLSIMGKPDTTKKDDYPIFSYGVNDDSYGYVQILFDSAMRVSEIYFPK